MKKIDWTKPIRWTAEFRGENDGLLGLKVVHTQFGKAVVSWDAGLEIVDAYGYREGKPFIENVPEELYLRLCRHDGSWRLDGAGSGPSWGVYKDKQAIPRAVWEDYYGDHLEDENHILVKVPS